MLGAPLSAYDSRSATPSTSPHNHHDLWGNLRALLKIESVLPANRKGQAENTALLVPDFHVPETQTAPLGCLRNAIDQQRKIRFTYTRADGTPTQRTVRPLGLFFWGGGWTLGGWCELRDDFRTFRLDRMHGIETLAATFSIDAGQSLNDYLRTVGAE
jgi:predicted DNA-binding transcriptional regulator YafY